MQTDGEMAHEMAHFRKISGELPGCLNYVVLNRGMSAGSGSLGESLSGLPFDRLAFLACAAFPLGLSMTVERLSCARRCFTAFSVPIGRGMSVGVGSGGRSLNGSFNRLASLKCATLSSSVMI